MNSIIFFPLVLITLSLYNYVYSCYKNVKPELLLIISTLMFTFIFGCRVNFGIDHPTYLDMYIKQGAALLRCEPIFVFITKLFLRFNVPYQIYFMFLSFLQVFFIILGCKRLNINYSLGFIVFFIVEIFIYNNAIRQAIAISIIFYAYSLFLTNKKKMFLVFVLIATGFHKSSFIAFLLLLYALLNKKLKFEWIYYIPFFIVLVFYSRINILLTNILTTLTSIFLGEFVSSILGSFTTHQLTLDSGLGVKLRILLYIMMLPKLLDCAKESNKYRILFNIFYVGILGEFYMSLNMNLVRMFFYGSVVQVALIPMTFKTIYKENVYDIKNVLFIFAFLLLIFLFIINSKNGIMNTMYYNIDLDFSFKKRFPI